MINSSLDISTQGNKLLLKFSGELNLYKISYLEQQIKSSNLSGIKYIQIDLSEVNLFDTASAIFIKETEKKLLDLNLNVTLIAQQKYIKDALELVEKQSIKLDKVESEKKYSFLNSVGWGVYQYYKGILYFFYFIGRVFATQLYYLKSFKNIRFKEIAFEINDSGLRAFSIVAVTSFLIGLVVAYQSAYQLKIYGANIFLVDMLGISMLRELAPLMTAIVIAGRSGSAFTAQIGAMKITEEIDAMKTMGFDPYVFLVMPKIIGLMISMPILIFIADMMGIVGGMLVANIDLNISPSLFIERFSQTIAVKHFFLGILKGPFFAFLIAAIGIFRGLRVKDDTQSIGFNTTKSVVEAIFAVIVCDAIFSIIFTNMGI
ncbi:MlaE family lipid ABC transporter permease subunit [Sulfurimonas sp.]